MTISRDRRGKMEGLPGAYLSVYILDCAHGSVTALPVRHSNGMSMRNLRGYIVQMPRQIILDSRTRLGVQI